MPQQAASRATLQASPQARAATIDACTAARQHGLKRQHTVTAAAPAQGETARPAHSPTPAGQTTPVRAARGPPWGSSPMARCPGPAKPHRLGGLVNCGGPESGMLGNRAASRAHVFRFPRPPSRRPHRRLRPSHLLFALLALAALALAARFIPSNTPTSPRASATAIDGDTLRVGQQLIRLQGIDAPEFDAALPRRTGPSLALWPRGARWACAAHWPQPHQLHDQRPRPLPPRSGDLLHPIGWATSAKPWCAPAWLSISSAGDTSWHSCKPVLRSAVCLARHFRDTARLAPQAQSRGPLKRCRISLPGSSRASAARTA